MKSDHRRLRRESTSSVEQEQEKRKGEHCSLGSDGRGAAVHGPVSVNGDAGHRRGGRVGTEAGAEGTASVDVEPEAGQVRAQRAPPEPGPPPDPGRPPKAPYSMVWFFSLHCCSSLRILCFSPLITCQGNRTRQADVSAAMASPSPSRQGLSRPHSLGGVGCPRPADPAAPAQPPARAPSYLAVLPISAGISSRLSWRDRARLSCPLRAEGPVSGATGDAPTQKVPPSPPSHSTATLWRKDRPLHGYLRGSHLSPWMQNSPSLARPGHPGPQHAPGRERAWRRPGSWTEALRCPSVSMPPVLCSWDTLGDNTLYSRKNIPFFLSEESNNFLTGFYGNF